MADTETTEEVEFIVDQEGTIQIFSKKKWKTKWGVLSGGALYHKDKQNSSELGGPIVIQGTTITSTDEHKKKFAIKIAKESATEFVAFDTEEARKEWLTALKANVDKEPGKGDRTKAKKQSTVMRMKKKAGSSVATSAAGKGLIKEFLGKDGVRLIDIIKQIITLYDGKKKSYRSRK